MSRSRQIELLIPWESWRDRWSSGLGPALRRSATRWAGECEFSAWRTGGMSLSSVLHVVIGLTLLFAVRSGSGQDSALAVKPFNPAEYEIKILRAPYLPQLEDASGSESGRQGKSGGKEGYHPQQVIRVYRGPAETEKVIEAPNLRLPMSTSAVANVIVVPHVRPTVPVAASHNVPKGFAQLTPEVVPPSPDAQALDRETLDLVAEVVPPPPEVENSLSPLAPDLNAPEVVQPTVEVERLDVAARTVDLPALEVAAPAASTRSSDSARADADSMITGVQVGAGAAAGSPDGRATEGAVVLSPQAAETVGTNAAQMGSLAMSPSGAGTAGLGGVGGGTGTGVGSGSGSGSRGTGPGSGRSGVGLGNSTTARGGLIHGPGPGGTGTGKRPSALPGVTIRGGSVTLPSFAPPEPGRAGAVSEARNRPPLTVVATARSGGALAMYGRFQGARVYTIYIDTSAGMAVMQYSQSDSQGESFEVDLSAPEPLHSPVPAKVGTRILVSCTLGKDGKLSDVKIVEGETSTAAAPLTAALAEWIFRPVMRGDTPIAVQAVLGFSVDTK